MRITVSKISALALALTCLLPMASSCQKDASHGGPMGSTLNFPYVEGFTPALSSNSEACLLEYSPKTLCSARASASSVSSQAGGTSSAQYSFQLSGSPAAGTVSYSAIYPSAAVEAIPSGSVDAVVNLSKKQKVTKGDFNGSNLVFRSTRPLRFESRPSSFTISMSPLCCAVALKLNNLSAASVDSISFSATVSGVKAAICGPAHIDAESGSVKGYDYTGALSLVPDATASEYQAICYPFTLESGDYLDVDVWSGGSVRQIRAVVVSGKSLEVTCGAVATANLNLEGITPGAARREVQFTPDGEDPSGKVHPYMFLDSWAAASLKEMISSQSSSSPTVKIHNILINNANSSLNAADLTYSKPDGKRLLDMSRRAEYQIISCSYAYRMTGEQKYLDRAVKDLKAVCGFQDWNCKTHSLDAAEMSIAVGTGYDWLYDNLDEATRTLCEDALWDFALSPFLSAYGSGSYKKGYTSMDFLAARSNWNQVCAAGMVVAALALKDELGEDCTKVVNICVEKNKEAVAEMYDGGTYPEGYGYWTYGTTYQSVMNTALETVLGTDYGIYDIECFPTSGRFFLYMESHLAMCFGYSDGSSNWAAGLPMWYFAAKSGNTDLLYNEARKLSGTLYSSADELRVMPLLMGWVASVKLSSSPEAPTQKIFSEGTLQPLVAIKTGWTSDDSYEYLGIKGGKASTSHGHMDAGSFVFDSQGVRWARDYGGGHYADFESAASAAGKNYWNMGQNSFRWTVNIVNNRTHNTITVNGADYKVDALVTFSQIIDSGSEKGAVMDLTDVLNGQVAKAVRTVKLVNEEDLYVIDEITAKSSSDANVDWRMLSPATPTAESSRVLLQKSGKSLSIRTTAGVSVTYKLFNSVINSYDVNLDNAGYHLCGWSATVPKGQTVTFTTRLTRD